MADTLPAHFIVKDVAANDVLNIRSEPTASAEIVGFYGPYTTNIEVLELSPDGKWGKVGLGETNGWASLRFLEASGHVAPNEIPRPISCFGTEPFWTFNLTQRGDEFLALDADRKDLEPSDAIVTQNGFSIEFNENEQLLVSRGQCSDGMSDRDFGWQGTALLFRPDGPVVAQGCCTLDASN